MKYAYYPGCTATSTSIEYDESVRETSQYLGIDLEDIPNWTCCGASSGHVINHELALALPSRNLALANKMSLGIVASCPACSLRHKTVEYELENFQEEISLAFADRAVPSQLIATVKEFYKFLPEFIKIANIGRTLEEMALSIIEIKRRVNALEYILIPELEAATKYIRMKLSESERSTLVRLMKVKDIVRAKN